MLAALDPIFHHLLKQLLSHFFLVFCVRFQGICSQQRSARASLSLSICNVQPLRPCAGVEQATASKRASPSPSNFVFVGGVVRFLRSIAPHQCLAPQSVALHQILYFGDNPERKRSQGHYDSRLHCRRSAVFVHA